ncbi:hypothetical protein BU23DRAFT_567922 [Bimuria novae-zelandiae CBS 107.79]|uniref:lytic cellulose monooxygenase (C4-dehydrogenating) n=1 Tax=Bimuria novae-zelandiae CBS 107.79 TaxID=1447943 RepID=A0A6A5VK93_9PLEO|nr:hypothetical protein BU23DRAFT_567922 [Bimuria novae-zelandiae CBS 107.79]
MKTSAFILTLPAILQAAQGHWIWARVAHNGVWLEPLRFIRNHTSPFFDEPIIPPGNANLPYRQASWPTYSNDLPNSVRCGRGTFDHAATTETLKVKAGDTLEVQQVRASPEDFDQEAFKTVWNCSIAPNACCAGYGACSFWSGMEQPMDFNHFGPRSVHLSKVPNGKDVTMYDGSGEWTKIDTVGVEVANGVMKWTLYVGTNNLPPRAPFKIPKQTPAGQYLLRIDLMWPGTREWGDGLAQLYPGCVQIEVESVVKGSLPKGGVKIPEILARGKPGTIMSEAMQSFQKVDVDYVYPGGPLWDGEKLIQDRPPLM